MHDIQAILAYTSHVHMYVMNAQMEPQNIQNLCLGCKLRIVGVKEVKLIRPPRPI